MDTLKRRKFFKKVGALAIASFIFPEFLYSRLSKASPLLSQNLTTTDLIDYGLIDLHFHALKIYLWDRQMKYTHIPVPGDNVMRMQTDIHRIKKGHMKGFLTTHYLPEIGMEKYMKTLKTYYPLLKALFPNVVAKVALGNVGNFGQLNIMMDEVEQQICDLATKQKVKIAIAKNYADFDKAINSNQIAVAHAIEGAHALGQGLCNADEYLVNLHKLKARGVAMMTLSHFFANDISYPVEGMAPNEKNGLNWSWNYDPCKDNKGLTAVGKVVVAEMLKIGMIVDLTHSTPQVRSDVFGINKNYKRPLVFSHVGVRNNFIEGCYPNYKWYDPSDNEIKEIIASNGVIGVIFENYWLTGRNSHMKDQGYNRKDYHKGINNIIKTIQYIKTITDSYYGDSLHSYDHIAFGSDFDGLADSPSDLYTPAQLPHLINAMHDCGIEGKHIKQMTSENVLRVLAHGWV